MENSIETTIAQIGPKEAEVILRKNKLNRPYRRSVILNYARQMKQGKWMKTGETIIIDKNGNLQDGQHRLKAVLHSGTTQEFIIVRGTDEDSFAVLDSGLKRNGHDVLYIVGFSQPQIYSSLAGKLIKWEKNIFFGGLNSAYTINNHEILVYCMEHKSEMAESVNFYIHNKDFLRRLMPSGYMIFLYHLFKEKSEPLAFEFFERLLNRSGGSDDSPKFQPIYKLRDRLLTNRDNLAKIPYNAIVLLAINAWNAFRQNRKWSGTDSTININEVKGTKVEIV
jgi:hypothetical protein